jgi:hypothetical protein
VPRAGTSSAPYSLGPVVRPRPSLPRVSYYGWNCHPPSPPVEPPLFKVPAFLLAPTPPLYRARHGHRLASHCPTLSLGHRVREHLPGTLCTSPGHALPSRAPSSPYPEPPRPPPLIAVARPHRSRLHPNLGHTCALCELRVEFDHFPGRECRRLAGIGPSRAAPHGQGSIASPQIFPVLTVQSKGIFVKVGKDLGTPLQKGNFNSKRILQILVKSLENCREIRKMQTQFC